MVRLIPGTSIKNVNLAQLLSKLDSGLPQEDDKVMAQLRRGERKQNLSLSEICHIGITNAPQQPDRSFAIRNTSDDCKQSRSSTSLKLFNKISFRQSFLHKFGHVTGPSNALFWGIFTLSILLLFSSVLGEEELVCQKGVSGFRGATFPRGDIFLREGDTLKVYCRLDLTKTKYNASFIRFNFTKHSISKELMKTTVINETTALLQVERMNVSSPHLSCEVANPSGNLTPVCQNEIRVGYLPLPVENFRCIALEWRSLNCSWTKPFNPVPTNYVLQIVQRKTWLMYTPCPNSTITPTSCVWGPRTEPFYNANVNPLRMQINGTNVLSPGGVILWENIDHWSIVVPEAPEEPKIVGISSADVTVSWTFKNFKDFVPGLFHEVKACLQDFPDIPCNTTALKSSKGTSSMEHIIVLHYSFVNYTIDIRMRSQKAKDDVDYWSKSAVLVAESKPKSPVSPPNVDIGSYESVPSKNLRDVYIYWEQVPQLLHNGPGFKYEFTSYEDGTRTDIVPKDMTNSYAKFEGLALLKSYHFKIMSVNDLGNSSSVDVFVPKSNEAPGQPRTVSKLDFTNGSFEVSWNSPVSTAPVSYTVFRCVSSKPRPYQCQGLVEWDVVSAPKQRILYNYLPHHNDLIYQFAVSANFKNMSSGMVWASCTLIHDKIPEKLNKVKQTLEDEKEIRIEWQLDCSYNPGVVDGFKISYCLVQRAGQVRCIDDEKSEAVSGFSMTNYTLSELQPCSTYMIAVSIITSNGESQKSDPIYASTKQSAPTNPPTSRVVKVTNTSATITITPSYPLNGVVKEYKIQYKSADDNEWKVVSFPVKYNVRENDKNSTIDSCHEDGSLAKQTDVEIDNLVSNLNYTFVAYVCTVKCSTESEPQYFKTKIGYTDFKHNPGTSIDGGNLILKWVLPSHLSGPIKYFEVLVKRNEKPQDIVQVEFKEGVVNYRKEMKVSCDSDTNVTLTAQVRAVTELETGELIYGGWSPPGNFNCGGGASWVIWAAVVFGAILIIALVGFTSHQFYQYLKRMRELDVKLPPGLAVQDLNGFSHKHPKRTRKNSEGDTQSFGKENSTYQMTSTHHSHQPKEFTSLTESCLQENETGFIFSPEMSFDNKVYMEELEQTGSPQQSDSSCPTVLETCVGADSAQNNSSTLQIKPNKATSLPITELSAQLHPNIEDDSLNEKRLSSSPTNPLLDDSQTTEDEETLAAHEDLYSNSNMDRLIGKGRNLGIVSSENVHSTNTNTTSPSSSGISPPINSDNPGATNGVGAQVPDVLSTSGAPRPSGSGLVASNFPSSSSNLNPPPANQNSSYVKWTQMMPEQFMNGDSSLGIADHTRTTPYCQVGILLDSN